MSKNKAQWYSVELIGEQVDGTPVINEFVTSILTVNDVQNCIISILKKADIYKINNYLYGHQTYGKYDVFHEDECTYEGFFPFNNSKCSPFLYMKDVGEEEKEVYYRYFVWATSCGNAVKAIEEMINYKGLPHG
jgi:hypothetical protein